MYPLEPFFFKRRFVFDRAESKPFIPLQKQSKICKNSMNETGTDYEIASKMLSGLQKIFRGTSTL